MPQIIKTKDDSKVVFLLSCFVGHPVVQYKYLGTL